MDVILRVVLGGKMIHLETKDLNSSVGPLDEARKSRKGRPCGAPGTGIRKIRAWKSNTKNLLDGALFNIRKSKMN